MKITRTIFVFTGNPLQVQTALESLHFKGLTVLKDENTIHDDDIHTAFTNNKSIACPLFNNFEQYLTSSILIQVVDTPDSTNTKNCIILCNGNISEQFEKIADMYNCDIGDNTKNSSGINGKPTQADCCYCTYLANGYDICHFRTIYSSKYFYVVPTVGQFCVGYLLIIPYKHVMSSGEFNQEQLEDFNNVLDDVRYLLTLTYGVTDFLVWENGTGNNGKGKAKDSVVHSHIHIAPSKLTAQLIKTLSCFDFQDITWQEITKYGKNSYLLIHCKDDKWVINDSNSLYIPRQYIRQLIADEYGMSDFWNWRDHQFESFMYQTTDDILSAIVQHKSKIPERILRNTQEYLMQL